MTFPRHFYHPRPPPTIFPPCLIASLLKDGKHQHIYQGENLLQLFSSFLPYVLKFFLKTIYYYWQALFTGAGSYKRPLMEQTSSTRTAYSSTLSKRPIISSGLSFSLKSLIVLSLVSEHNSEMIVILMMLMMIIMMMMMLLTMIIMMLTMIIMMMVLRSSGQYSELEVAEFSKLASQLPQTQQQGWGNFNSCKIVLFPINFPLPQAGCCLVAQRPRVPTG